MQNKLVCISENYAGLGDLGDPIIESRCTTVEAIKSKADPLAYAVFRYLGHDGLNSFAEQAERGGGIDTIYLRGNWTIDVMPCDNGGNCAGCPNHWYSTTGETWDDGMCWESVAETFVEMEEHLGRSVTKDERAWLINTIYSCKPNDK